MQCLYNHNEHAVRMSNKCHASLDGQPWHGSGWCAEAKVRWVEQMGRWVVLELESGVE